MIRRRVLVRGAVQGVFFRRTCVREAESCGAVGWVRNRLDGTVEAVFEGPEGAVEPMVAWCRRGPPGALVERVDVRDEPPEGLSGFVVRRDV
ncbi:acylphosphatase [Glycomyces xiaoerkulensis]|uniref:acylphosphatase n=1 Tax=Glycomyces xiaoerkulensis TaxID=2038139 RepID=UPI000C25B8CF|nr:acylphosphatase [Glycomyces xiaoerkulensis]